jgi:hypothetical protein
MPNVTKILEREFDFKLLSHLIRRTCPFMWLIRNRGNACILTTKILRFPEIAEGTVIAYRDLIVQQEGVENCVFLHHVILGSSVYGMSLSAGDGQQPE